VAVHVAQTNIQLYNQLREAGRPSDDLALVHGAYEFLTTLYPGYFQADGKPFVAHGVGVASILASLDQPAEILAVGLLHNIYTNADFGDGHNSGITRFRRRLVREAVGERIEHLLGRFRPLRIHPDTIESARRALPGYDETERRLILVDLADHLEKYVDLGVLYLGENDWVKDVTDRIGSKLVQMANELGEPKLAEALSTAFAEAAAHAAKVPPELRPSDRPRYTGLVAPRSYRPRLHLQIRAEVDEWRERLRPRTRLRQLMKGE
jgi:(p)ppGpp synthase/HD superfamily hydrolase